MHDIHGPSRMQPTVRLLFFLQLLHVTSMLIRRETTPKNTNIIVGREQDCDYLPACHMDRSCWSCHFTFASIIVASIAAVVVAVMVVVVVVAVIIIVVVVVVVIMLELIMLVINAAAIMVMVWEW